MVRLLDWVVAGVATVGIASSSQDMSQVTDIPSLIKEYGALIGLVVYFLIRDDSTKREAKAREDRMANRINELEDRQHGDMAKQFQRAIEAQEKAADASERVARVIEHCQKQKSGKVMT